MAGRVVCTVVTDEILELETLLPVIRSFDALPSGVSLRITHEVLGGTWEALREERAYLVVDATNEPPSMPQLRWFELGLMEWTFAVPPRHPLAKASEPLTQDEVGNHCAVVVANSSSSVGRAYGLLGGQATSAVPRMSAKISAQRDGLGVDWLPRRRISALLKAGQQIEKQMADPREPNALYVAWRGDHEGRALSWWLEQLRQSTLAKWPVDGVEVAAGIP